MKGEKWGLGIQLPQMSLPKLEFQSYIFGQFMNERIGRRNCAIGHCESDQRSFRQKGRPVTKIRLQGLPSNLRFWLLSLPRRARVTAINPVLSTPHTPTHAMNTAPEPSHGDLLVDRLRRLDILDDHPVQTPSNDQPTPFQSKTPHDGYGFRPSSGKTSPRAPTDRNSPLPDVNGLGWPGKFFFYFIFS
jgi:hypothetical protein